MSIVITLTVIIAILLVGIVLIQNPKGGGLASNFSQGTQLFGVAKTTDLVEKITWTLAGLIVILSLWASSYNPKSSKAKQTRKPATEKQAPIDNSTLPKMD